ncbi:chemotaxis protein CheD [Erythrobacter sp. 3-20A1M]|nr:chemotaxis protein CheD [Erythrobacter sp. 3-20A1M]
MTRFPNRDGLRRITVAQGEGQVCGATDVVLTTVLGSCVAACFYDPFARIGGLNHYLLAEGSEENPGALRRYGVHAMEVLINEMLAEGAMRHRLKARIFGGARMHAAFKDIGSANIAFARSFLAEERIPLVGEDVGGTSARRVEFRPGLGLARSRTIAGAAPPPPPPAPTPAVDTGGDVEFF